MTGKNLSSKMYSMDDCRAHIVLFDGECPLCVAQMRWISKLDWLGRFKLLPISAADLPAIAPQLADAELQAAIHCVAATGEIYRGARCLRFIGLRLPLLAPLAVLLWIPGVIHVAEVLYARVSRNRLALSRFFGCDTACELPKR